MAGSYPDAPSRRMAFDKDGTLMGNADGRSSFSLWSSTLITGVNSEAGYSTGSFSDLGAIFPELREVDGVHFLNEAGGTVLGVYTSADTTCISDGVWVQQIADVGVGESGNWRQIESLSVSNVRGMWVDHTSGWKWLRVHIYGEITPGQTPDRLLWIDNLTALEFGLPIDYGDVPRGSASDTALKLRNNSSSLTASTVQITAEALTGTIGTWFTFSEGGAFQSTLPLASSIGPGADSPVITARRVIPDADPLGVKA